MPNNLAITPGVGALVTTDQITSDSSHAQVVKIAESAAGSRNYIPSTVANGLTVDVTRIQTAVIVNNPTASDLKVDASGATVPISAASALPVSAAAGAPIAVRLSTGSAFIDTVPVSIAATVTVAGTVAISGTPAVAQSGTWNIATVTTITNAVTVTGTVALSGTSPVSGTVTANQGTAAAVGSAWVTKITDGTNSVGVTNVSGAFALKVDVIQQVGGGVSQADQSTFTNGTTFLDPIGGVFNDSITAVGSGKAGAVRITSQRAQHVNLRDNSGNELGIGAAPLRIDPTGGTIQPVNGTVTVNQGATAWVTNITQINGHTAIEAANGILKVGVSDSTGTAFSAANPLPVVSGPTPSGFWKIHVTTTAGQTAIALRTPAGGKTMYVEGMAISISAGTGRLAIFDNTDTEANALWSVLTVWAFLNQVVTPSRPIPLAAVNNVLRYTTTTAVVADITVWGYDA
jgi:hypothetical protein